MPFPAAAVIAAGATLAGQGMGMANAAARNKKQFRFQKELMDKAYGQNQSMALFNNEQQMKMWEATGPTGQMKQLKAAGLNPGLIYGMGGAGGQTAQAAQAQGQGVPTVPTQESGAEFGGMAMQLASTLNLQKAQKENIEANTEKIKADTANAPLTGQNIQADTENTKANTLLTNTKNEIAKIEQQYQNATLEQMIANISTEGSKLMAEARTKMTEANITGATQETQIKQIQQNLLNAITNNKEMKQRIRESAARVHKTDQEIQTIIQDRFNSTEYLALARGNQSNTQTQMQRDNMYKSIAQETGLGEDIIKMIGGALIGIGIKGTPRTTETQGYSEAGGYYESTQKTH